jgi:hypothetical protein
MKRMLILGLAGGMLLLTPAAGKATVTIGSNLGRAPDISIDCGVGGTTMVQRSLASANAVPSGIVSPVNGTVVRWRIRTGNPAGPVTLRVIKPFAGSLVTGAGTSTTQLPVVNDTTTFLTQLPIVIGEKLGIDCYGDNLFVTTSTSESVRDHYIPTLVNGGPARSPSTFFSSREVPINADIEPTSAFTVSSALAIKGGKVQLSAVLPNAGTLTAGDAGDTSFGATSAKKKKKKKKSPPLLLNQATTTLTAPGIATLELLPTKAALKKLTTNKKGKKKKVAVSLKLAFTPTGGTKNTQTLAVKLTR